MSPFPRGPKGIQWIRIQLGPGVRQISTGTTDAKLAGRIDRMCKELADRKQFDLLRGLVNVPRRLTIDQLWEAYQRNALDALRERLRAARLADYRDGFVLDLQSTAPRTWQEAEKHIDWLLARAELSTDLTPGRIRDLLNQTTGGGGTKRHKLYTWSAFCRYLVAHGVLPANPCADRDLVPRPPKAKKRKIWHTADVDLDIINRMSDRKRIAAVLCSAAGADRSTTLVVRVKHVHLLPVGTEPDPSKGLEHRIDLLGTKADPRERMGVRLEPWAAPILREWMKGKTKETLLVENIGPRMITVAWRKAADEAGYPNYWLRDTRHSYGARAILAGYPLWLVSDWLGHSNEHTTADIYTNMGHALARAIHDGTRKSTGHSGQKQTADGDAGSPSAAGATPHATRRKIGLVGGTR